MQQFDYVITDEIGIHARPAGLLVKETKKYASVVTLKWNDKTADAKRLMAVMSLGVKKGSAVTVIAEGEDEETAIAGLQTFFTENL